MSYSLIIFLGAALLGSATDLRSRRIPNLITYGAATLVLLVKLFEGPAHLGFAAASLLVTIGVGSIMFGAGWIGGGDIKLIAVGAAAITYPAFLAVLLYIAVAGGVVAIIAATSSRRLSDTFKRVALSAATRTAVVPHPNSARIPYALAICAGAFTYAASESIAPWLRLAH